MTRGARSVRVRPRVLFYSHDGFGLGHLRITLAIADAVGQYVPDASRMLLTGSTSVSGFNLPESVDYVRIPGTEKWDLFETDPGEVRGGEQNVFSLRKALIAATIDNFAPHLTVVDHNPAGLADELLPVLKRFRNAKRRPLFVFGMRDITYGPEATRKEWEKSGSYQLMEEVYDLILVYGSPVVFDPVQEYGLSPAIAAKTVFTGYFRRPELARPMGEIRRELGATSAPLVVVSVGGGGDGAPVIEAFLTAIQQELLNGIVASIVAGPQMSAADFLRLSDLARSLPSTTLVRFRDDLVSHVVSADAVICMGGYNSVWEAVGAGKRPIVVPRMEGSDEQALRAERLASLGLGTVLEPCRLTPEQLASAVIEELNRGISPVVTLDFDGLNRAGVVLSHALENRW